MPRLPADVVESRKAALSLSTVRLLHRTPTIDQAKSQNATAAMNSNHRTLCRDSGSGSTFDHGATVVVGQHLLYLAFGLLRPIGARQNCVDVVAED
jgi:hypothetical protein